MSRTIEERISRLGSGMGRSKYTGLQYVDGLGGRTSGTLPSNFIKPIKRHRYASLEAPWRSSTAAAAVATTKSLVLDNNEKLPVEETPTSERLFACSSLPVSSLREHPRKRPRTTSRPRGRAEESAPSPLARPATSSATSLRVQTVSGGLLWGPRDKDLRGTGSTPEITSLTSSHHDDSAGVFATATLGGARDGQRSRSASSLLGTAARSCRSLERATRPFPEIPGCRPLENLGNWPLNMGERLKPSKSNRTEAQERIEKLQKIHRKLQSQREQEKASRRARAHDSSASGSSDAESEVSDDEPSTEIEGPEEEKSRDIREKRRKMKKRLRKRERRAKKLDAERKSCWNRERWRKAGRHGGIVARARASLLPALAGARGDLGRLKAHADRFLLAKLARCWERVARAFGVACLSGGSYGGGGGGNEKTSSQVPPPPSDDDRGRSIAAAEFWDLLVGPEVGLSRVEADVVFLRIAKGSPEMKPPWRGDEDEEFNDNKEADKGGGGRAISRAPAGLGWLVYGNVHESLFNAEDAKALTSVLANGEGRMDERETERRSGEIAEIEEAYVAGLGYPPPPASAENSAAEGINWWSDGGAGNRWARRTVVRKALYGSLQAGTLAHLPLEERLARDVPWVQGKTHITLHRPKEAFLTCAKYGCGFQGLSAAKIVLALRVYVAERIQAQWRGRGPRRRYAPTIAALRVLVVRERGFRAVLRASAFRGWWMAHEARMERIRGTRREFYSWKAETSRLTRVSELFRGIFWPLYVWRRWTNRRISAMHKARFLRRVYLTSVLLRHFLAWNRSTDVGLRQKLRGDKASRVRLRGRARRALKSWAARAQKAKRLRERWIDGGMWLRVRVNERRLATGFVVLRYWAFARALCARRGHVQFRSYYLLGEMDRRHAVTKRLGNERQRGRGGWSMLKLGGLARVREGGHKVASYGEAASQEKSPSARVTRGIDRPIAVLGRPNFSSFPGLEETHFGGGDGSSSSRSSNRIYGELELARRACAVLREHFESKVVRMARVNLVIYQRLGPKVLARLRSNANEKQRSRFATVYGARRAQRNYLRAWRAFVAARSASRQSPTCQVLSMMIHDERRSDDADDPLDSQTPRSRICGSPEKASDGRDADQLLGEDRRMRRWQLERTAARLKRMLDRTEALKDQSAQEAEISKGLLEARKSHERAVADLLARESARARTADERAQQFAAGFNHHAAQNLVDVVDRIYKEVVHYKSSMSQHAALRQWRSWYLRRVSVKLFNRQRLRDWLRICARLRYLWRGMPLYRELRVKWSVFHRLLDLTDNRILYGTPGTPTALRRRKELLLGYSDLLRERGFVPGYYAPEVLLPATLDVAALLQRWKQHAQGRACARLVGGALQHRRVTRVIRAVFDAWSTGKGPRQRRTAAAMAGIIVQEAGAKRRGVGAASDDAAESKSGASMTRAAAAGPAAVRGRNGCFAERRAEADLNVARRTVVAAWRGALARTIGLRQAQYERRMKQTARRQPTFKTFIAYHIWQANERVRTETGLLVDAFLNRGKLKFLDLQPPVTVGRSSTQINSGGSVFGFSRLVPFRDKPLPGSHLVHEVRVATRVGVGVVGVQLVVMGGKRTYELPVRGVAPGESRSATKTTTATRTHAFTVDTPVERLSHLECEQEGNGLIERLRAVTSGGRVSPWFGERLTPDPQVVVLPDWRRHSLAATLGGAAVEEAGRTAVVTELSDEGTKAAGDEAAERGGETAPPWDIQREYITGLVGVQTRERLVELGVLTRHVIDSHVFSYLWEAPEEDERFPRRIKGLGKAREGGTSESADDEEERSDAFTTLSGVSSVRDATSSRVVPEGDLLGARRSGWDRSGASAATTSSDSFSLASDSVGIDRAFEGPSPSSTLKFSMEGRRRRRRSNAGTGRGNPTSSKALVLSRAEAKRQKYVQDKREWEQKQEQRTRYARRTAENMKRQIRGEKTLEEEDEDEEEGREGLEGTKAQKPLYFSSGGEGRGHVDPTPQEEFAGVLRMRRTDTRLALERSILLAKAAYTYRGEMSSGSVFAKDPHRAISSMPVVMGLTRWLHKALLPQHVPLPLLTEETEDLFHSGERAISTARATRHSADRMKHAAERLERRRRRQLLGRGLMSPSERAKELQERKDLVEWTEESVALREMARLQRKEGERLFDSARDRLPKVSQTPRTLRMYLDSIKLIGRQIELEREFGMGALRRPRNSTEAGGRSGIRVEAASSNHG